ncbi:MAG TPA: NrfD/PsrC family molybdoenzyme membrane anchor subunit [Actinomycetes bacterium]|nr:NrfD/PsrC family molybdoenzyme membrane anchor subunit [Actinomycetes bacterium]
MTTHQPTPMGASGDGSTSATGERRIIPDRSDGRRRRRDRGLMVPEAEFRSYYGRPIIKEPAWTLEVPWYFFVGGMAGASAPFAVAARLTGNHRLARSALTVAGAGVAASVPLLVSDLGRPERFHHMLRVIKPTSPMSMGSWVLAAMGPAAVGAAVSDRLGILPGLGRAAEVVSGLLGPALCTYTGVLVANTAVPVWHEAGRELPVVFAGSALASAGAASTVLTPAADAGPARRLAVVGALVELATAAVMERRLGELAEPYHQGPAGRYAKLARGCTLAGAAAVAAGGTRRRWAAVAGSGLLLAGSALERLAVYKAGFQSAGDPKYVVKPQRARLEAANR